MSQFVAKAGQVVVWEPQEGPQTALLECPVFEVFYGGARGGGKTESSIGDWLQHSSLYGENAIGIFVRRKLTQLSEVIARTKQIFTKLGAKYQEQQKTWTMPNGARLKFVYLERDSDAEEYQGHSYTRIYVEELTNFPSPGPIDKLRATLRSGTGVPCGMRLTGNPGGPGHNWVKARYIVPNPAGYEVFTEEWTYPDPDTGEPKTVSLDRVFIPSKLGDNRLLMRNDPTYVLKLRQAGSEALVKAWLEGNWDIVDGAFFDEWDESKHVLSYKFYDNFRQVAGLRFRAFDWGSAKPFSVGWYLLMPQTLRFGDRVIPKDALVKYREWYGAEGPNKGVKMEAGLVAQGILEREKGERISYGVADPAIYIRDGGPSIADSMALKNCTWRKADNKRVAGASMMRSRLVGVNGVPMLYFLETCEDSIRTIPVLQHDEKNPEDLDTDGEDHSYDETRYAVMSRPWQPSGAVQAETGLPLLPSQTTIMELVERLRRKRLANQE
ncbi:large subunit terminase [Bacteriophage sp.]|nr:large subunit terminase [Bacteriophage sp.]